MSAVQERLELELSPVSDLSPTLQSERLGYFNSLLESVGSLRTGLPLAPLQPPGGPPVLSKLAPPERAAVVATWGDVHREELPPLLQQDPSLDAALSDFVIRGGRAPNPEVTDAMVQAYASRQATTLTRTGEGKATTPTPAPAPSDPNVQQFISRVKANFAKWDKNKDGFLSKDELKDALKDPSNVGQDAIALATLYKFVDQLQELSDDELGRERSGVTLRDLDRVGSAEPQLQQKLGANFQYLGSKVQGQTRLFEGEPDWQSVRQGSYGNCYFLAALVGKAKTDPGAIKRMIKDNQNGTYTVTFPGRKPVTITAPTEGERALSSSGNGLWVAVLEKAWGTVCQDESWLFSDKNPFEEGGSGGWGNRSIHSVTGKDSDTDILLLTSKSTTRNKLEKALKNGKLVVACIYAGKDRQGLPAQHMYSVLAFDRASDRVTLRNPWGHTEVVGQDGRSPRDGQDDGIFQLSLDEFCSLFSEVTYEN